MTSRSASPWSKTDHATTMALKVKHVAQMAVTNPTSRSFFLRPLLSIGNLHPEKGHCKDGFSNFCPGTWLDHEHRSKDHHSTAFIVVAEILLVYELVLMQFGILSSEKQPTACQDLHEESNAPDSK